MYSNTLLKEQSLLRKLIIKGDYVAVKNGLLEIVPRSNIAIPKTWYLKNSKLILNEIIRLLDIQAFRYISYSTGRYGKEYYQGVTLQFENVLNGEEAYVIFNVDLTRSRNTKNGKKGTNLPKGHFNVRKKADFLKFWLTTSLTVPKRLSSFHDYMGNLKGLVFVPAQIIEQRIQNKLIPLLRVGHSQLVEIITNGQSPVNRQTIKKQTPNNIQTTMTDKDIAFHQQKQLSQPYPTTSENHYGKKKIRLIGSEVSSKPIPSDLDLHNKIANQTIDEWLDDYDQAKPIIAI